MRRRGTPTACCSSCGKLKQKLEELWNRVSGAIVKINNISADGNNEFTIQGGDRISITPISNGIEIASSADAVGVATINNEDPDSDGNFDITAGSGIIVTPGTNEVEVKADTSVLMDLSSAQSVTGSKTFDGRVYSKTGFVVDNSIGGFLNFRNANSVPKSRIESDADGKLTIEPGMNSGTNAAEIVNQRAYDPANTNDIATIGTLDSYTPMVRTVNDQSIAGVKTFQDRSVFNKHVSFNAATYNLPAKTNRVTGTGWVKMYESANANHINSIFVVLPRRSISAPGFGIIACGIHWTVAGQKICKWMNKDLITSGYDDCIMITVEASGPATIWAKNISSTDNINMREIAEAYNGDILEATSSWEIATDKNIYTMNDDGQGNYTGYTDNDNVTHTFFQYEISS